nr:GTP pyrophosphokinase [Tanacetum cinerariifolium]
EQFGATVRHIVEGETKVSKLGKLKYKNESHSVQDVKAHDLQQMFLAMTDEVQVIIVKSADILHNMRTLSHMASLISKGRKVHKIGLPILQLILLNLLEDGDCKWCKSSTLGQRDRIS